MHSVAETLMAQLLAMIVAAIILGSFVGTNLQPAIDYFFQIAGLVFGVGAVGVVIVVVLRR